MFNVLDTKTAYCEKHGEYEAKKFKVAHHEFWSSCEPCGTELAKEEERKQAEEFSKRHQENMVRSATKKAGIPRRFENRTLDNYKAETEEQARALEAAMSYAEEFDDGVETGRSMIFCGTPGTGKTHLAIGIAHKIIPDGYAAGFTSVMNAVRRVRETYRKESTETEREAIESFAKPHLLILDEVGQQRGTDDEKVLLFDIINARYEEMRPTIVISNLDLEGIRGYLGDRAFDRLREGGGRAVHFTWDSYRRSA